jgi:dolichol-phosphate mannosyltransferase
LTAEEPHHPARRLYRRPRVRKVLRALASPSKFALVGILGIVVNQVALYVFTDVLGIYYLVSAVLASQVSTLNNFLLTEYWVFGDRQLGGSALWRYLAFNAINVATLFIRIPVLYVLTDLVGVHYLVSNLVAIGATFGVRYLVADNWIWAGRDRRAQRAVAGAFQYDVQGLIRIQSPVALPELAAFNLDHVVEPDLVIRRRFIGGGLRLRAGTTRSGGVIRYREQLGVLSAAFDVTIPEDGTGPIVLDANWLLVWSHHVLYTNMVEPLLRFMFVDREHVLLHCAAVDAPEGAIVMSALTDTGKTSTVLRLLMHHSWGFLSDDMAIVSPAGEILAYPKPMTLSSHTMSSVNERVLPAADRFMLAIRSRLHSREGRAVGHALGRLPIPIVTVNAWVQILVPPPKYHVTSLLECDMADRSRMDSIILMERGEPLAELPSIEATVDRLLDNTDDAYTFPPYASFSKLIAIGGRDYDALRARERELLTTSIQHAWRVRIRVRGHNWSDLIPTLVREKRPLLEADAAGDASDEAAASAGQAPGRAPVLSSAPERDASTTEIGVASRG